MPGLRRLSRPARLARRVPFTLAVVGVMVVLALATGSLWSPLGERDLLQVVGYGLPALQAGRWWTPLSGAFFAMVPAQYLPVAGGALLLVGWSELRLGTRRVAGAAIAGHLVAVLGAAAVVLGLSRTSWDWAARTAGTLDVGFSGGALAALAAASVTLRPPWRARVRLTLVLYAVVSLLYVGLLWDLEHLLAVATGLAAGPFLVGRRPRVSRPAFTRHEWRVLASTLFVVLAAVRVVLYFLPSDGPLGATTSDADASSVLVGAALSLALAWGLKSGSRRAWQLAVALAVVAVVSDLVLLGLQVLAPERVGPRGDLSSSVPQLAVDALLWLVQLTVLVVGRSAFRARSGAHGRAGATDAHDHDVVTTLLRTHGGTTLSWMGMWPDNRWFILHGPDGAPTGYVAFQLHRGTAIALGDPVAADPATRAAVLQAFVDDQEGAGHQVCCFSVTREVADWGRAHGWRDVVVAEEAVIDLAGLEFTGRSWQSVRTALNRAEKERVAYLEGRLAELPRSLVSQVRAISELWVADKALPEMGFTLGGVDEALDPATRVGLAVDASGTVQGVTSWLPVYSAGGVVRGWTLDLMRRLPDGFRPVTEFLIASACLSFREQGAEVVSLSGAPLAHAGSGSIDQATLERLLDRLGTAMEPLYGFRSLEIFKQKFRPRHEPVHLVFGDEAALPRIGLALTAAYLPGASVRELARATLRTRTSAGQSPR
ncbi:DUF2156 domain-containing protein [Terrabacter sp. NPDC080008]|uniref:bifunctional lysylphosphatidylglycerol flippase/synthetase MprF n=1 Tax=Terrabacter sp. NPDC080008 TaxID=3155176 RepID=UPI003450282E